METYEIRVVCAPSAMDDLEHMLLNTSCYVMSTRLLPAWKLLWWRDTNPQKREIVYETRVCYTSSAMSLWCENLVEKLVDQNFVFSLQMDKKLFYTTIE
jgi:hypothetical protein